MADVEVAEIEKLQRAAEAAETAAGQARARYYAALAGAVERHGAQALADALCMRRSRDYHLPDSHRRHVERPTPARSQQRVVYLPPDLVERLAATKAEEQTNTEWIIDAFYYHRDALQNEVLRSGDAHPHLYVLRRRGLRPRQVQLRLSKGQEDDLVQAQHDIGARTLSAYVSEIVRRALR